MGDNFTQGFESAHLIEIDEIKAYRIWISTPTFLV